MIDNPKTRNVNWRAMQVPMHRSKEQGNQWLSQGDTNVKQMSIGSWKAYYDLRKQVVADKYPYLTNIVRPLDAALAAGEGK